MKISELIARLAHLLELRGDLQVVAGEDFDSLGPLSGDVEIEEWWHNDTVAVVYTVPEVTY